MACRRSSYPRAMESAECSVPLAPRLLMKTTLRVMRTHRATTTAPASQERRKGFCSDSIRTSHMVESWIWWATLRASSGCLRQRAPSGFRARSRAHPRADQANSGRVGRISPEEGAVPAHYAACGPKGIRTPDFLAASQTRLNGVRTRETAGRRQAKAPQLSADLEHRRALSTPQIQLDA